MVRATILALILGLLCCSTGLAESIDLSQAVVVVRAGTLPAGEKIAASILVEEVERRTGLRWTVTSVWPEQASAIIALSNSEMPPAWTAHSVEYAPTVPRKPESFSIRVYPSRPASPPTVFVMGQGARGTLFGTGKLLRNLDWKPGRVTIRRSFQSTESPDRPIRGHQIGYRDTANSWDAWTFDQFDQYFRELAIFGTNAVENIPWQEDKPGPLMKYPRDAMNLRFAELCDKYDLDHWIWVPVLIKLPDTAREKAVLDQQEQYYRQIKRLDAIFVPGGDPGDNKAVVLLPHLERMARLVTQYHPRVKIWLSLQHFKQDDVDHLFEYLAQTHPTWFGGLVMGPGSPPLESTRQRLPASYQLRWYPDITHTVRCQYPVPWLDPILGMTLGREPVNPRPVDFTQIYRMDYGFTNGFVTYSDGVHDDFNKCLWSQLGWNPAQKPRDVAIEYARFHFQSDHAELGADGLFALESDTRGPLEFQGSTQSTLQLWTELERQLATHDRLSSSGLTPGAAVAPTDQPPTAEPTPLAMSRWRFQMHLLRACYVDYTRRRLIHEAERERQALHALKQARDIGTIPAINRAKAILSQPDTQPFDPAALARIHELGESLFTSIGLQTSVPKYHASNSQRGAILDFLDYPLNNRWWLEDQFERILKLPDPVDQLQRLDVIRNWENPGDQGYYDVVGDVGRSPRIAKLLFAGDSQRRKENFPIPTQRWMREVRTVNRLAWHSYLNRFPQGIEYNDIDTTADYVVRLFSQKASPLEIDGTPARLLKTGEVYDKVTEQIFEVPREASSDGRIKLTWEKLDESQLNWRDQHYVTDIWVMKKTTLWPESIPELSTRP